MTLEVAPVSFATFGKNLTSFAKQVDAMNSLCQKMTVVESGATDMFVELVKTNDRSMISNAALRMRHR